MVTLISLDTNIFLNVKNKEEPFFEDSTRALDLIDENKVNCVLSTIVLAEMCAGYYENNEVEEKNVFLSLIASSPSYRVVPVDAKIADFGGEVRAEKGIRLPDALIAATAAFNNCMLLVTHDETLRKIEEIRGVKITSAKEFCDALRI